MLFTKERRFERAGRQCGEHEMSWNVRRYVKTVSDVCPEPREYFDRVPGMSKAQVIHVDYMCNECGNCRTFCPYASAPYLDKFTLFKNEEHMADSKNDGFTILDREAVSGKVRFLGETFDWSLAQPGRLPDSLCD